MANITNQNPTFHIKCSQLHDIQIRLASLDRNKIMKIISLQTAVLSVGHILYQPMLYCMISAQS